MTLREFSPKQKAVLSWWRGDKYDAVICDGAIRSGKTLCMSISFVCWAMACFSGAQFGMCGKTVRSLRRNVIFPLLGVLEELGFQCSEKISDSSMTVRYRGRENKFCFFGGRDESSAALIQGVTLAGVMLDEAALMPRSFVEQACGRCSVAGSKLWFNCNPEHPGHWFYKEWIEKAAEKRALYLHFTMEDNPSLSEKTRERYRRLYTGSFYRRFILGEWVMAEGRVYDFFDSGEYLMPVPEGGFSRWRISCDYGTVNPASFGLWGEKNGVWYRVKEYYYASRSEGRQKTDEEYADDLLRLAGERSIEKVIVDPSAASFIECLRRRALRVEKADNDVMTGIRVTADMLKKREIVICDTCEDSAREFYLYCWDTKSGCADRVVKKDDHAMDDIRYFAMSVSRGGAGGFAAISVDRKSDSSGGKYGNH